MTTRIEDYPTLEELGEPALGAAPCEFPMPFDQPEKDAPPFSKLGKPPVFPPEVDEALLDEIPEGEVRDRARIRAEAQNIRQKMDVWTWENSKETREFCLVLWKWVNELNHRLSAIETTPRRVGRQAYLAILYILGALVTAIIAICTDRILK